VNTRRLRANAIEADEQSERLSVPDIPNREIPDVSARVAQQERRCWSGDEQVPVDRLPRSRRTLAEAPGPLAVMTGRRGRCA